jgi:hypothetical protein
VVKQFVPFLLTKIRNEFFVANNSGWIIMINRSVQIFQKPRNHLKILGAKKKVTRSNFFTQAPPYNIQSPNRPGTWDLWKLDKCNDQKKPTLNPTTIGHMTQAIFLSTPQQCSPHYKTVKTKCNSVHYVNGPMAFAFRRESVCFDDSFG